MNEILRDAGICILVFLGSFLFIHIMVKIKKE